MDASGMSNTEAQTEAVPTTGRFTENRYYELNPVGFNAGLLCKSITPSP